MSSGLLCWMYEQDLLKMLMGGSRGFRPPPEVLELFKAKGGGSMGLADQARAVTGCLEQRC